MFQLVFEWNNDSKLLYCKPKKTNDKEEEQETFTEVLMRIAAANASSVKIVNYGALKNAEEEGTYYFVQWVEEPYELNEALNDDKMFTPEGPLGCNAKYLNKYGYGDWLYLNKINKPEPVNLKIILDTHCPLLSVAHLPKRGLCKVQRKRLLELEAKVPSSDCFSFLKEAEKLHDRVEYEYECQYDNDTEYDEEDSIVESDDSVELDDFE